MLPRSGDVLRLSRAASIQFSIRPILFRVIRVHDWQTYDGWAWLDGYELDSAGEATERRSVFVQINGLQLEQPALIAPVVRPPAKAAAARNSARSRSVAPAADRNQRRPPQARNDLSLGTGTRGSSQSTALHGGT